jgi:hypothetical protein
MITTHGEPGGAADDGWAVLVVGLGQWGKLEGASGRAPSKVIGGGAHPSGMPAASGAELERAVAHVDVRHRGGGWW